MDKDSFKNVRKCAVLAINYSICTHTHHQIIGSTCTRTRHQIFHDTYTHTRHQIFQDTCTRHQVSTSQSTCTCDWVLVPNLALFKRNPPPTSEME